MSIFLVGGSGGGFGGGNGGLGDSGFGGGPGSGSSFRESITSIGNGGSKLFSKANVIYIIYKSVSINSKI